MKELWQRTTFLFWQYPVLWIPLTIADLFGFALRQLERRFAYEIALWVVQNSRHSVISTTPDLSNPLPLILKTSLLSAPFAWSADFAYLCFYVVAFLMTAALTQSFSKGESRILREALADIPERSKDILRFAFRILLCFVPAYIFMGAFTWLFNLSGLSHRLPLLYQVAIEELFVSVAMAYFLAPSAIRFLRRQSASTLSQDDRSMSRKAAMIAMLVAATVSVIQAYLSKSVHGTYLWVTLFNFASSVAIAFPLVPLFIAIALIAFKEDAALDFNSLYFDAGTPDLSTQFDVPANDGTPHAHPDP